MPPTVVTNAQAQSDAVSDVGLSPGRFALESPEVQAAALRQAGSYLCPTGPRRLISVVTNTFAPLLSRGHVWVLDDLLQDLTAFGDFVESRANDDPSGPTVLYLGAPGFVSLQNGEVILVGIRPDGQPLVGEELSELIDYRGHLRHLKPADPRALRQRLLDYGLLEHELRAWLKSPPVTSLGDYVATMESRLDERASGDVAGVQILDPSSPVTYYKGRWRRPKANDSGRFVARRPRDYGADLWCFMRLRQGVVTHLLDLPTTNAYRGCDEAWQLQAALDATNGTPQRAIVRSLGGDRSVIAFTSPIPMWHQRRLSLVGDPVSAPRALLAYSLPASQIGSEVQDLRGSMWLEVEEES